MRLFTKYNRVSIMASILALLLGSVGYYFAVRYVLLSELDDDLTIEEAEINDFVRTRNQLPEAANYGEQPIFFQKTDHPVARRIENRDLDYARSDRDATVRELVFSVQAGGQLYKISILKSE